MLKVSEFFKSRSSAFLSFGLLMVCLVVLSACGSSTGNRTYYYKSEFTGLAFTVDPATGAPTPVMGQGGVDFISQPNTAQTQTQNLDAVGNIVSEVRQVELLQGSRKQWDPVTGNQTLEILDNRTACGAFGSNSSIGGPNSDAQIITDKVASIGVGGSAVCDGLKQMYGNTNRQGNVSGVGGAVVNQPAPNNARPSLLNPSTRSPAQPLSPPDAPGQPADNVNVVGPQSDGQ